MPINRALKVMFIHNPKCGGSSMERFFGMVNKNNRLDRKTLSGLHHVTVNRKFDPLEYQKLTPKEKIEYNMSRSFSKPIQHLTPQELIDEKYITEEEFRNNFSFVFVRNPWDKVISSYESYFKKLYPNFNEFLAWVKMMVEYEKDGKGYVFTDKTKKSLNTHFKEQYKFLNYNGEQIVNFVGRHETINKDFKTLCELVNVPYKTLEKVNVTAKRKHYSAYYNEEQMNLVGEIYKSDIELFDYKFDKDGYKL